MSALLLADVLPRQNPSSGSSDWLLVAIPVVVVAIGAGLLLLLRSRRRARRAVEDQDKS
jgi:cytochrome c-type biogenesis protein CcmH/NrfF